MKIVRIDGSLFFGSVSHVQEYLHQIERANPNQKHLLIIATGINFIDLSGADLLAREAKRRRSLGGSLLLSNVNQRVRALLERSGALDEIGRDKAFLSKADALAMATANMDWNFCQRCDKRVFLECETNSRAGTGDAQLATAN